MAQVIIVSNRLPISVKRENAELVFSPSLGGLATGLSSYVNDPGNTWIGWPGIASDDLNEAEKQLIASKLAEHNCYPVFLSQKQIDNFYNGYSNSVLWPAFHNLPSKRVDSVRLDSWWQAYRKVNQHFVEAIVNLANAKSQVWVHDYQLMLLPEMLRAEHTVTTIGFFLHIPFPDQKSFARLPEAKRLLNGILGADLIGFHTADYVQNFMGSCASMAIGAVSDNQVNLSTRSVRVGEFPMGIDYEKYAAASKSKGVKRAAKQYRHRYGRCKVIVSVDRLDPTKGLEERLRAYREFLERNPQQRGKVVFAMVAAPSRTDITVYAQLAKRLELLAQEINETYGSPLWQPVDYMNISQPFEEVAALFQVADVAFIAPLRDGMNLSAKEFVASNHKRGVLILSETAGAAQELHDALIVNPREQESLVNALQQALTMHKRELRGRLKRMKKDLSINTVQHWAKTFVDTLQQPLPPLPGTLTITRTLNKRLTKVLLADYHTAKKRLLLLDYDGSLVPFTSDYRNAKPPKALLQLLEDLIAEKANNIVIISGRSAEDLDAWFGTLPVNLVAEHGAATKKVGNKTWQSVEKTDTDWKQLLLPALEKYARLAPGARVEVKPRSLVWHYRAVTPYHAQKYVVIIKRALRPILKTYGLELLQGNKVLEIKNPRISKANAAEPWLRRDYKFILAIGDDVTDESLFVALPTISYSVKVGRGRTAARFRLASSKEIMSLLRKLTKN
jgi:trehalose 6-phosphate synthase/phosphatase